jgi:NAD(P)-dependent dehydrogenase (short-subunit alcohol dehydrogenase family)
MNNNQTGRVLITGGTSGLGLEVVKQLLREGYIVCATGRNLRKGSIDNDRFFFVKTDFSILSEMTSTVNIITERIGIPDIIINNAGILSPPDFTLSNDGFELSFQINLVSHLLLNELFIRQLASDKRLLIASVTSPVYMYVKPEYKLPVNKNYSAFKVYAGSKYHILSVGQYLAEKYPEKKIDFIGFNPGTFRSGIYRMQKQYFHALYRVAAPFMRSPERIAQKLAEIIKSEKLITGAVYRSVTKIMRPTDSNRMESFGFLDYCSSIVNDYLK